jgi:hypothetical protein
MQGKSVLLDADVIIEAFRQGIWVDLVSKVQVFVARPIVDQADFYPDPDSGQDRRIDLRSDAEAGRIRVLDTTDEALAMVTNGCRKWLDVHDGEKHALAALSNLSSDHRFCTGDKAAIQALVLLDLADRAVSMERMLGEAGVARAAPPARQFTDEYLKKWVREGGVLKAGSAAL